MARSPLSSFRGFLYKLAHILGDISAVKKGRAGKLHKARAGKAVHIVSLERGAASLPRWRLAPTDLILYGFCAFPLNFHREDAAMTNWKTPLIAAVVGVAVLPVEGNG